jgi:phenylacetate-CoA ligase
MMPQTALALFKMMANQWKSRSEIEDIQEKKLRALISHARKHIPKYKKYPDLKSIHDLPSLPIISKSDIRKVDQFLCQGLEKSSLNKFETSGSTGMPLTLYTSHRDGGHRRLLYKHRLIEAGFMPFNLMARVMYSSSNDVFLYEPFFRTRFVSCFDPEEEILKSLKSIGPDIVSSYPSLLALLAKKNLEDDNCLQFRSVFSIAEVLSKPIRVLIKKSFSCDLRDTYGAIETGPIAFECKKGSMHLHSDSIIAEVVDDHGDPVKEGKYGNILLTPLWQRTMPLIRYNLADKTALLSKCKCGRGSPVLKSIEGRSEDYIVMRSGRLYHHTPLSVFVRYYPGILAFRGVQDSPGQLSLKIVPKGKSIPKTVQKRILDTLQDHFPEPMEMDIEIVDKLPLNKGGKMCSVVSKVKHDFMK